MSAFPAQAPELTGDDVEARFGQRLQERGIAGTQAQELRSRFRQRLIERKLIQPQGSGAGDVPHDEGEAYGRSTEEVRGGQMLDAMRAPRQPAAPADPEGAYTKARGMFAAQYGEPTPEQDFQIRKAAGMQSYKGVPGAAPPVVGRQNVTEKGMLESAAGAFTGGFGQAASDLGEAATHAGTTDLIRYALGDADANTIESIATRTNEQRARAISTGESRLGEIKTAGQAAGAIFTNPQGMLDMTARSLGQSIPGVIGAPATAGASVGMASAMAEFDAEFKNLLAANNIDPADPRSLGAADRELVKTLGKQAATKAGVVGLFDWGTAKLGSLVPGGKTAARKVGGVVARTLLEAGGGMAGEAGSQLASRGKVDEPGQVVLEGVAELPGAVTESGQLALQAGLKAKAKASPTVETRSAAEPVGTEPPADRPQGVAAAPAEQAPADPYAGMGKRDLIIEAGKRNLPRGGDVPTLQARLREDDNAKAANGTESSIPPTAERAGGAIESPAPGPGRNVEPDPYDGKSRGELVRIARKRGINPSGDVPALIERLSDADEQTESPPASSDAKVTLKHPTLLEFTPTKETAEKAAGYTLEQRLFAFADEEKAARAKRKIPRGKNVGAQVVFDDVVSLGIEYAARAAGQAVKGSKAITAFVRAQMGPNASESDVRRVAGVTKGVLKDAFDGDKLNPERFDAAIGAVRRVADRARTVGAKPASPNVKTVIRKTTGQMKTPEGKALAEKIGAAERAATKAYSTGKRDAREEGRFELSALRDKLTGKAKRQAQVQGIKVRAAKEGAVESVEAKASVEKGLREEAVRLIREHLPTATAGKYVEAVRDATNPRRVAAIIRRITRDMARGEARNTVRRAERASKKANPARMLEQHRKEIEEGREQLKKVKAALRAARTEAEFLKAKLEAREILDAFKGATHRQQADEEVRVAGKVHKRETLVTEGIAAIRAKHKVALKDAGDLPQTKRAGLLGKANYAHLTPDSIGSLMGDRRLRRLLSEDFWDGETLVNADSKAAMDEMFRLLKEAGYEPGADATQRLSRESSGDEATVWAITLPDAGEIKATPGEWLGLWATLDDAGAGRWIEAGAGTTWSRDKRGDEAKLSAEDIEAVKNQLAAKHGKLLDVARGMKRWLEAEVRPGLFEAFRQQTGYDLKAVERYWPTRRNREQPPPETLIGASPSYVKQALENLGFEKEREGGTTSPYLIGDLFSTFHDHTRNAAAVTHMTARVRSAEMIFKDPRMRKEIELRFGEEMNKQIEDLIERGKLIFHEPKTKTERGLQALSKNIAKAKLTLNPSTMAKQVGGIFKLLAEVDPGRLTKAIGRMWDPEVSKTLSESAFFRDRYEDAIWRRMTPSLGERGALMGQATLGGTMRRLLSAGKDLAKLRPILATKKSYGVLQDLTDRITLLNWFDSLSARATIAAHLIDAEAKGVTGTRRRRFVERKSEYTMRRTQNTHSALDQSGFSANHRGDAIGLVTMFTSDANKSYNMLVQGYQTGGKKGLARAALAVALNNAWAAAVAAGLSLLGPDRDDEGDAKRAGKKFGAEFVRNTLGMVYLGDWAHDLFTGIGGDLMGDKPGRKVRLFDVPHISIAEDLVEGIRKIAQATSAEGRFESGPRKGEKKSMAYLWEGTERTAIAGADLAGLPASPLWYRTKQLLDRMGVR